MNISLALWLIVMMKMMDNITITELQDGYFQLIPNEGYELRNKFTTARYSEVITKRPNNYFAEKIN